MFRVFSLVGLADMYLWRAACPVSLIPYQPDNPFIDLVAYRLIRPLVLHHLFWLGSAADHDRLHPLPPIFTVQLFIEKDGIQEDTCLTGCTIGVIECIKGLERSDS